MAGGLLKEVPQGATHPRPPYSPGVGDRPIASATTPLKTSRRDLSRIEHLPEDSAYGLNLVSGDRLETNDCAGVRCDDLHPAADCDPNMPELDQQPALVAACEDE